MSIPGLNDYSQYFRAPRPRNLIGELIDQSVKINDVEIGKLMLRASDKLGELGYAYRKVAKILATIVSVNGGQMVLPHQLIKNMRDFEELEITDADEQGRVWVSLKGAGLGKTALVSTAK